MSTPWAPDPDSFRAGNEQIAVPVNLDAVGNAIVFLPGLLAENAAVGQRTIRGNIVNANISLLTIIHLKLLTIRRECQPVGLTKVFGQQPDLAVSVETVHTLKWNFLLLAFG